jgi:membrane-associated phospholipid phosphatase
MRYVRRCMAGWSWLDERERPVLEWLAGLRGTAFDDVMRDVSTGPPRALVWALATIFACLRTRSYWPLAAVVSAFLLAQVVSDQLKALTDRPRPPLTFATVHALVELAATAAFPSGHATTAAAVAAALWWSWRRASLALGAFAVLIALSRVWLGVHYPSDVVAGLALGAVLGLACALATRTASARPRGHHSRSPPPRRP